MAYNSDIYSTDFSTRPSTIKNSVITVKTSKKKVNNVSSVDVLATPVTSYSVKGTGSFNAIHQEVAQNNQIQTYTTMLASSSGRPGVPSEPTTPPTGELLPVGDMLMPMLAMALVYLATKLIHKRKTSQAL